MKINLSTILGGFNLSAINERLKKIEDEFNNKVLYRDNPSDEPNQMQSDLDMNGHRLLNVSGIEMGEATNIPLPSDSLPQPIGLFPATGTSVKYAREDHVHVGSGVQGDPGTPGKSNALVYAYKRSSVAPTDNPGNITYDFWTAAITEPVGELANGWKRSIPEGTDDLYVVACSASSDERTDTIEATEWSAPVKLAANGANGANGLNAATIFIYQRTPTPAPPVLPSVGVTYTFSPPTAAGLNNGWSSTIPDIVYGDYLWVSTATAASTTGTDNILPSEWATPQIMGRKGDAGKDGANGGLSNAVVHAYKRSTSAPVDNPGNITYSFTNAAITVPDTLANGWSKTIPSGNDPLYVVSASASGYAATDDINAVEWTAPVQLTRNGLDGLNTATIYIYNRETTSTPPALPSADVTYDFTTKTVTGLNNGWTAQIPSAIEGDFLFVASATAASTTNTDTIPSTEWATPSVMAQSGVPGVATATLFAYKRSAVAPTDTPGDVVWDFQQAKITTPSTDALANGWTKSIPAGSNPLYVTVATASGTGTTDSISSNEWATPVIMARDGAGINIATVYIYQRTNSATAPVLPSANATFTFSAHTLTGLNNGWLSSIPPSSGGQYLWVSTATASSATEDVDTILSTEWAAAQIMAKDGTNGTNGSNGTNGTRGTVTLAVSTSATSWTVSDVNTALANAGYYPPINRDVVTLYNTSANYSETRFYDNGSWLALNAYINGNMLVNGTLSASKISGGTFSGASIDIGSGKFTVNTTNGLVNAYNFFGYNSNFGNLSNPNTPAINASNSGISSTTVPTIKATTSTAGAGVEAVGSATGPAIKIDGTLISVAYSESANKSIQSNNVIPIADNTYNCGTLAKRWMGITSATAVVVSSDKRLKTEVENSDLGLSFINSLRPVSYKLITGKNEITKYGAIPKAGTRKHYGLIAQEVKQALGDKDAAFWILENPNNPDSSQALRYEELIAPLIKAVQELSAEVEVLKSRLNDV